MSILSRNKFFAGRRLPESRKCGGLRAAVFLLWPAEGRKCLPRDEMPAERRYAGRCEGRPVCSAAVFLLWPAAGRNVVERRNVCREVICRAVCLAGRSVRFPVGLVAGLFGRRFSAAGFWAAGSYGCRFVRGVFFVGAVGRFLGLLVFRGDFPVGGCGNVSNA